MQSHIMRTLVALLESDGPDKWEQIADAAGCRSRRLPAKLVYGARENPPSRQAPRIDTIEPLLMHYGLVALPGMSRRKPRRAA